jgi:hypothetical protein
MKRKRNSVVIPFRGGRGKETTRRNLENEASDEGGKREECKAFPVSVRNGTKGIPWKIDGITPGLRFGGVEGQLVFALVPKRGIDTKSRADESDGDTRRDQNIGRNSGFLVPSNETLGNKADKSTEIEDRIETTVERRVGEIESIFIFHLNSDGNTVPNGSDVLHA